MPVELCEDIASSVTLLEQDLEATAARFIARAERLTNGVENLSDKFWREYNAVLTKRTRQAFEGLQKLIAELPEHPDATKAKQGYIDFQSAGGRGRRNRFLRDVAALYANWQKGILVDLDIKNLAPEAPPWERSLGLHPAKGGHFLMRLRDEIVRKAHELAHILDQGTDAAAEENVSEGMTYQQFQKRAASFFGPKSGRVAVAKISKAAAGATEKVKSAGVTVLRQAGRGISPSQILHSPASQKSIVGVAKNVIQQQEAPWMENVLKGMEDIARKHANDLYDVSTGTVFRQDLRKVADKFAPGEISRKQQELSVMTHVRAMIRRLATSPGYRDKITGVKLFLQVPPTRDSDLANATGSVAQRAYTVTTLPDLVHKAKGSGDSLGLYAGDPIQPVPIPPGTEEAVKAVAAKARKDYLAKLREKQAREGD